METLLSLGLHKQAEQLYKDFRVPDKRCVTEAALLLALSFTTVFPVCPSRLFASLTCLPLSPVQVLVVEVEVSGGEGGVG